MPSNESQYSRRKQMEADEQFKDMRHHTLMPSYIPRGRPLRFHTGEHVQIVAGRFAGRQATVKSWLADLKGVKGLDDTTRRGNAYFLLLDGTLHYVWLHEYDLDHILPDPPRPDGVLRPEDV